MLFYEKAKKPKEKYMNKIQLVSDTSCDFTAEEAAKYKVELVPFSVSFDGENYQKEIFELTVADMYQRMIDNPKEFPKSSTPNPNDYFLLFSKFIDQGYAVICLCITQKFSSSYQSALIAKQMILDENPDAQIEVIDSIINTVAQGLLLQQMITMRDKGMSFSDIIEQTEAIKKEGRIFFTVGSLDYLAHGGRIGKVSSLIGKGLQIKPLIVLENGDIHNRGVAIGRARSILKVIDAIISYFHKGKLNPNDYAMAIGYGYDKEEAVKFLDRITNEFKKIGFAIHCKLARIGATIAVHTGPNPLGLGIQKLVK